MVFLPTQLLSFLFLVVGFGLLIKGADFLVDGGVSLAKKYKIPSIIIGMTIVAFGTSAPELVVNIISSLNGSGELAFGNVIGSNISNILLILGVSSIIYPLTVDRVTVLRDIPYSLVATIVCFFMVVRSDSISRTDGLILLALFSYFLFFTFFNRNPGSKNLEIDEVSEVKVRSVFISLSYIVLGILGLTFGGKLVIDGATQIAKSFGISESIIGLTIVAIGTSLPELATSIVAAMKKQTAIAIGNIVGSNIFNLLWILGISAVVNPINISANAYFDVTFAAIATLALFLFLYSRKVHKLTRLHGIMFLLLYLGYMVTMFIR